MKTYLVPIILLLLALIAFAPFARKLFRAISDGAPRFMLGVREQLTLPVRLWHKVKYRRTLCLSNTAANPSEACEYQNGLKSYYAETGLLNALQFLLVKQGATSSEYVDLCGATDDPIGTVLDTATVAGTGTSPDRINVHLLGKGPTSRMVASGVIAAGVPVYAAAGGKIASTGTRLVGRSIFAAGADLDVIAVTDQAFPSPTVQRYASAQKGVIDLPLKLVQVTTNMNVYTSVPIPFACTITAFDAFVCEVVTTGSKLTTITPFIGSTAITGAGIALTSANCTPLGAKIAGGAITAANVTAEGDTLTIKSTSTTAFAEGAVVLHLQYTIAA